MKILRKNVSKIWKIHRILVLLCAILKNGNAFNGVRMK